MEKMRSWFSREPGIVTASEEAAGGGGGSGGVWGRIKTGLGLESQPDDAGHGLLSQLNEQTTLSRTTRVYGFVCLLAASLLCGMFATFFWWSPPRFAVLYTISNLFMLGSTMFLMGPLKQLSNMFDKGRIFATLAYLGALVMTLFSAIKLQNFVLTLIFFLIQICAMIWYSLSYIPFAREMVWKMMRSFAG